MMGIRPGYVLALVIILAGIGWSLWSMRNIPPPPPVIPPASLTMTITSPNFKNGETIPVVYTCDGKNMNPELVFGDIPAETQSLAIIMDDPDAPRGTFTHWTIWNINPAFGKMIENSVVAGSNQGTQSAGKVGYVGPCPPEGAPHRYFFRAYALDATLALADGASRAELEKEIAAHQLAAAELMGTFGR